MRTVRDEAGDTFVLLKESSDSCKLRDPETGEETYRDAADLEPVAGESPLTTTAQAVPEPVRRILTATPDERALGLLVDLRERGPHSVRYLLDATDRQIGGLFPCNVVIWQEEPGVQTVYHVSIMRIARLLGLVTDDAAMADIIDDTGELVEAAFENLDAE